MARRLAANRNATVFTPGGVSPRHRLTRRATLWSAAPLHYEDFTDADDKRHN